MADLPEDIIPNILSRLPVKSLLRFRCVSKHWCCLIGDSDFVKMHLNHAIDNENFNIMVCDWARGLYSLNCDTSYAEAVELDYPYKSLGKSCTLMCSCNGLMYLQIDYSDIIWNSCTKEFKNLPSEPIQEDRLINTWEGEILYGIGYNPSINDYQIVKVHQYFDIDDNEYICSQVMVYTLGTHSWRIVGEAPYYICRASQLTLNGNPHWLLIVNNNLFGAETFIYFDLVSEKFCEIENPNSVGNILSAGLLGGCLCILGSSVATRADVWVMKDYGVKESWVKLYTINQSTVSRSCNRLKIICQSKNGKFLLMICSFDLILYDPKLEEASILQIQGLPAHHETSWDDVEIYVGSLVSLKTGTYVGKETKY